MSLKNTFCISKILISSLCFVVLSCVQLDKKPIELTELYQKIYPNHMFTKSYGILNDSDFIGYEPNQKLLPPEHIRKDTPSWVCAPTQQFKFELNDMGPSDDPTDVENKHNCDFLMKVTTENFIFEFLPRRAYPIEFCREIISDWESLAAGQSHLCVAGEALSDEGMVGGKMRRWLVYKKIKSKKKCLSLFLNDCNTKTE